MIDPKHKPLVLLAIYGEGGHKREMTQLLRHLANRPLSVITMGPEPLSAPQGSQITAHVNVKDVRHKDQRWRTLLAFIPLVLMLVWRTLLVRYRYPLAGVISCGPGLCILPMLLLRLLGVKTIYIETNCRFHSRSLTGRLMSKIAHRFLVQNKELLALYPKAEYCGRL